MLQPPVGKALKTPNEMNPEELVHLSTLVQFKESTNLQYGVGQVRLSDDLTDASHSDSSHLASQVRTVKGGANELKNKPCAHILDGIMCNHYVKDTPLWVAARSYFSPNVTNGLKYYLSTHDVAGLVDGRLRAGMVTHMGRAYFNEIGKIDRQGSSPPSFSPRYAELTQIGAHEHGNGVTCVVCDAYDAPSSMRGWPPTYSLTCYWPQTLASCYFSSSHNTLLPTASDVLAALIALDASGAIEIPKLIGETGGKKRILGGDEGGGSSRDGGGGGGLVSPVGKMQRLV